MNFRQVIYNFAQVTSAHAALPFCSFAQVIVQARAIAQVSCQGLICITWYYYIKEKYGIKATLCYKDTSSFIIYLKTRDLGESNELGGTIKKEFLGLHLKMYPYLRYGKRLKGLKTFVFKRNIKFKDYRNCNLHIESFTNSKRD